MQVSSAYSAGSLWLNGIEENSGQNGKSSLEKDARTSGDTAEISSEARRLFSEMIHKYDQQDEAAEGTENCPPVSQSASGSGPSESNSGLSGSSGEDVESIRKKIQSLKSQISALASQNGQAAREGNVGMESANLSKMNALESQIAALEAQLNALSSQA